MVPPRLINIEQSVEILRGTCPTVSPLFLMATAYQSRGFSSSRSQLSRSPITGVQLSWYT